MKNLKVKIEIIYFLNVNILTNGVFLIAKPHSRSLPLSKIIIKKLIKYI